MNKIILALVVLALSLICAPARAQVQPGNGAPIVILATGQSNFVRAETLSWTPAPNVFSWNFNGSITFVDGAVGTSFVPLTSNFTTVIRQPEAFASVIGRANPGRPVYVIDIAIGSQPISQWLPGASAPDMFANVVANVVPALAQIGVSKIDIMLWWEGENQTLTSQELYVDNFNQMMARFQAQSWFPSYTPVMIYGIAPTSISGLPFSDTTNSKLQMAARQNSDVRRFVYTASLGPSVWLDALHFNGAGHLAAGELVASAYLNGDSHLPATDPISNSLRPSALGRPSTRNLILEGDFTTNQWNFGTTFTAAADATLIADQWAWAQSGAGVVTIAKTADAPTAAQAGMFTQHCLDVAVTTADASITNPDYYGIKHTVNARRSSFLGFGQAGGLPITISFWVKSSVIGNYFVAVENSALNRSFNTQYTIYTADTWEKKFVTVFADASGTWQYSSGAGLILFFTLASSDTYLFTPDTWNATDARVGNVTRANAVGTIGNHFKLALVQAEEGVGPPSVYQRREPPQFSDGLGVLPVANGGTGIANASIVSPTIFTRAAPVAPQNSGDTNDSSSGSGSYRAYNLTASVPASFMVANRVLKVTAAFRITTGTVPTAVDFQLKYGGTVVAHVGGNTPTASVTNTQFVLQWLTQATAAPGASVNTETAMIGNANGLGGSTVQSDTAQPVALATNGTLAITVESKWAGAGTGVNQIKLSQLIVEAIN